MRIPRIIKEYKTKAGTLQRFVQFEAEKFQFENQKVDLMGVPFWERIGNVLDSHEYVTLGILSEYANEVERLKVERIKVKDAV